MKKCLILIAILLIISCGESIQKNNDNDDNPFPDSYVGTDETFDVMTWNLKEFPLNGNTTVSSVKRIIEYLSPDFIAMQEINNENDFEELVNISSNWSGFRANSAYYNINLAVLYNNTEISINNIEEIYVEDYWAFPRRPLVIDCNFKNKNYIIIDNHLKAGGGDENEERRLAACDSLKNYLDTTYPTQRVILLGDLNDELTDPPDCNVFWEFIADSTNYKFADMEIAKGSHYYWSYPSWPSHLDHILITNELYSEWENGNILTLRIGDYEEFSDYSYNISDHRPVLIKLK